MLALNKALALLTRTTAFRLIATYGALFILIAALIAAALYWQTNELLTRQVLQSISSETSELRSVALAGGPAAIRQAIEQRSSASKASLYYLVNSDGRKLAGNLTRWPRELGETRGGLFHYLSERPEQDQQLAVGIPISLPDGERLLVARDVGDQLEILARVRNLFLIGISALVVAGLAAGIAAGRLVLRRIEAITSTSETIMAGDLSRRIPVTAAGDELDELAGSLNVMLDRIEQLMAGLREVSDNIAHDLKTPLNRLRNRAEAALRDAQSVADYRDGLERTIDEADVLIKTFNALLLIAKLEAGAVDESLENFDLTALVTDIVDLYEPLAQESGLELMFADSQPVEVRANRQLIGQAIANLIDNAIKYGIAVGKEKPAPIEIAISRTANQVKVAVADHGPGIPAADRERVLKRFVRLEASRTRPGTGLGLSLVAAVARLHGGAVNLEDNKPGLRVTLWWTLPLAA